MARYIPFLTLVCATFGASSYFGSVEGLFHRDGELAPLYGLECDECSPDSFGYSMPFNDSDLRETIRRDPGVLMVEANRKTYFIDSVHDAEVQQKYAGPKALGKRYTQNTVENAAYGLQMVAASGKLPTPRAGQGVNVYIFDSGIRTTHNAFQGRARHFGGLKATDKSPYSRDTMDDVYGHGTHVAGIVGARSYGVAPHANLINVKVTNNFGEIDDYDLVGQAISDVVDEHNANKARDPDYEKTPFRFRGSIINLSMGWDGRAATVQSRIRTARKAGIKVYAAAGNSDKDAKNFYPCALPDVDCVAAVDDEYEKAWFSNYGGFIDFVAPGEDILSLGIRDDNDLAKKSGTSMATAFASGAAAIFTFWQGLVYEQKPVIGDYIWWNSVDGLVTGFSGTTTHFINTGIHSKKKKDNEPFRWAGAWPVKNHMVDDEAITVSPAQSLQLTTFATEFKASTVAPIKGLTTEPADGPSVEVLPGPTFSPSFDVSSVISALSTVTFSFDPTTSTGPSATAAA